MRVIISGGGSGGHIFPAIAIAEALEKKDKNIDILFVGANGKMEMEKIPQAGYKIEGLDVVGFHRKKIWRNIGFPFKLFKSMRQAKTIIDKFKPDVAIGVGGFASGPLLKQAQRKGIPTVIQEQNSYPGVTNKLLAKKANLICVAYPDMEKFFPAEKIVTTGNPIRSSLKIDQSKKSDAYKHFKMNSNKTTTLIIGGSLGAKSINEALKRGTSFLKDQSDIQFIWQAGKLYYKGLLESESAKLPNVEMLAFIDRMDYAYTIADVVMCRSGALTISELANLSKPSILIPSPNVSEDHQTKNAQALVTKDAALMVSDRKIDEWKTVLKDLVDDKEKQLSLSQNISKFSQPKAADKIAKLVFEMLQD